MRSESLAGRSVFRSVTNPKASTLLITLWVLLMLATFAVTLGASVRQKLSLAARLEGRDRARYISWANIKLALVKIRNSKEKRDFLSVQDETLSVQDETLQHADSQGEQEEAKEKLASTENICVILDEERKININKADLPLLERFFKVCLGSSDMEAQELAAAIVDWRDTDSMLSIPLGSAEDAYYIGLNHPYKCKDADFDSLDELLLVKGITPEIFARIRDYLTVYTDGLVNVNTASREVLLALGIGDKLAGAIFNFRCGRDKKYGTPDDNYFTSASEIANLLAKFIALNAAEVQRIENVAVRYFTCETNYFMIKSMVRFNQRQNSYRVISVADSSGRILYWQEF